MHALGVSVNRQQGSGRAHSTPAGMPLLTETQRRAEPQYPQTCNQHRLREPLPAAGQALTGMSVWSKHASMLAQRTLTNVSTVNIPTKPMLNSSLKMVRAKQVSMMALLSFSFTRSNSISRSVPRNTCAGREGRREGGRQQEEQE